MKEKGRVIDVDTPDSMTPPTPSVVHPPRRRSLMPAVCDVSVTNACNARCSFCSFGRDKAPVRAPAWIDPKKFADALPIMYRRGIRHLTFQGGEPLLHPAIEALISEARSAGFRVGLITNGWFLPQHIEPMADAGLGTLFVSIDSHSMDEHERNRGLPGLGARIREGLIEARRLGVTTLASVAVNRLVDFDRLPSLLSGLGFWGVNFSYPRREEGGPSPLGFGMATPLTDYDGKELIAVFEAIKGLKRKLTVVNPTVAVEEMERRIRGISERFPCVGGHKYFCLDWNLDIWRCEAWPEPMGSVFDLDRIEDRRDPCTACMISCYRDGSVLMHAGVAAGDAARALARGRVDRAAALLFRRSFLLSLRAIAEELRLIARLRRRTPGRALPPEAQTAEAEAPTACVILVPDGRGMTPLFGVPAVRRLVLLARRMGLKPLYLVGRVEAVRAVLSDLLPASAFRAVEETDALERIVRALALPGGARVLVIKAHDVIDQSFSDPAVTPQRWAHAYRPDEGKPGGDGIYLSDGDRLLPLLSALCFETPSAPPALSPAGRPEGAAALPCAVGAGEKAARTCEAGLIASAESAVKADDSFLSRHVNRHISRFVSRRVVHSPITANQITLINGVIGLAGGAFLTFPGYWAHLLGALLFLFCVIMDGTDGEVARLKLQESAFGQALDYTVDNVVHVAVFAGMAVGLYLDTGLARYLLALSVLLVGFGLCALTVNRYILKRSTDELKRSPRVIRLMATLLTNRDFAYLVLAFAVIDRLDWFLWATAFGTYLFAAVLVCAALSEKRGRLAAGAE